MSQSKLIKVDHGRKEIQVQSFSFNHPIVFNFFNKLPEKSRDQTLLKALFIGVLALMEDRFSAFLARTANTLGTELESLKFIFDLQQELFFKTAVKGKQVENDLIEILSAYAKTKNYKDEILHQGEFNGLLPNNKTGDIVIKVNRSESAKIVIESKFDKAKKLGLPQDVDPFAKTDTAIGQLLEASVNRNAMQAIIVFNRDIVDPKLEAEIENIKFFPAIGFVCLVDFQKADFTNLFIAYDLARALTLAPITDETIGNLNLLVGRFLQEIDVFLSIRKRLQEQRKQIDSMIEMIEKVCCSLEFTKQSFSKFIQDGSLTKQELLSLYQGLEIKKRLPAFLAAFDS